MYNDESWYSLKKMKSYSQSFNGNGATGGKIKHAKATSTGLKIGGYLLGVYNAATINNQHKAGEISDYQMGVEQGSNVISTTTGIFGLGWGIGWEIGRAITTIPSYQEWKHDTWLPWRGENLGY